jgi:hypothetical protein
MTTSLWSVSTEHGSNLSADDFVGILSTQHDRVLRTWQELSPEQWTHPSRNTGWSVHDTARHVADTVETATAEVLGEPLPFPIAGFDPRTTPITWLDRSATDAPTRTIERFERNARRLRAHVGERLASGDDSMGATVYGSAHWSVMVVHLFWDSWLHERDMLLPLELSAESTADEQRLAAVYGLLMTLLPAWMTGQPLTVAIDFTGPSGHTVAATTDSGHLSSAETSTMKTDLAGDVCQLVDSLSGRGARVTELLPGAPETLGIFADFMAG